MSVLDRMLSPASIAILGASEDFVKINGRPLKFLLDKGYGGRIYPVNPKYDTLAGLPCYRTIGAIPEPVDLAIVAVPAAAVLESLRQCAAKGAAAAVDRVMATFSQAGEGDTPPGPVGFVTQSGAFGTAIFALARQRGLSLGYFINSGNEADVDFGDLLAHVLEDARIRVVAGYIEGLRDGRKLLAAADRALVLGKPIVLTKVARSGAGARAAASHTGSLAGTDRVYSGVFRQAGIIRAPNDEHLVDLAEAFTYCPLPAGGGVGLVTQSGGAGVLMADRCEELGLAVPELAETTREALRTVVPAFGAVRNPVDITAQFIAEPALLSKSLELVLADPGIDVAIFYLGLMERAAPKIAADLERVAKGSSKPLVVAWAGAPEAGLRALREGGVCVLPSATRAVDAVHGLVQFADRRRRHERERAAASPATMPGGVIPRHSDGRRILRTEDAFRLLAAYGIQAPPARLAHAGDEAARIAENFGTAVALKAESPAILHKTDAGAVRLGLRGADGVRAAFATIVDNVRRHDPTAPLDGVLVQAMVTGGTEMVVGLHHDPQFGPVVMVGLGGIFVEVLEDVAFGAVPLTRGDAEDMLASLRGARILDGVRGRPRGDRAALVDVLLAVSRLGAEAGGAIAELDLNPVVVLPEGRGAVALDALVVLSSSERNA